MIASSYKNIKYERGSASFVGLTALIDATKEMLENSDRKNLCIASTGRITCGNTFCKAVQKSSKGWTKANLNSIEVYLCKKCSIAFSQNQYCEFCKQVYLDKSHQGAIVDGKNWIQCENCRRWNHTDCEKNNGNSKIEENSDFVYFCRNCRKDKEEYLY